MGSPITFSGFNQIDFNLILNAVMAQESQPLATLQAQQKALQTQKTAFGTLATRLGTLQSAVEDLQGTDSLSVLTASSSDSGVGVATSGGSLAGTYNVVVTELARAQVLASTSSYTSVDDVVATSGTLTITPATGDPLTISVSQSTTLKDLAAAINDEEDGSVTAAVVQATPGHYKLVLTGKDTGVDHAFTVTSTLAGGGGLAFTDTDADNVFGDSAADNTQVALDAALTVNGLAVTSASNTVTDVVPGVTLTLTKKDPAVTAVVSVKRDAAEAKRVVNKFISAYNSFVDFTKDQGTAAVAGRASIGRDPVLRGFRNAVRVAMQSAYSDGGTFTRLAAVGIGYDIDGKMTLDESAFDASIASAPTDVQKLFSGATGDGGAFGALADLVAQYTQAGGLLDSARDRIDEQVRSMAGRLDDMQARLDVRRTLLQQQYTAADLAMTQLKSQSGGLSSLSGSFSQF